jgi:ribosome-associated protein
MNLQFDFELEENLEETIEKVSDEEFEQNVLEIISDMGGEEINCFENNINPEVCQRIIIASFISSKQIFVTVNKIIRYAKDSKHQAKCPSRRKHIDTEWTAIDCGNLMIHLFKGEVRDYYQLDKFFIKGE